MGKNKVGIMFVARMLKANPEPEPGVSGGQHMSQSWP